MRRASRFHPRAPHVAIIRRMRARQARRARQSRRKFSRLGKCYSRRHDDAVSGIGQGMLRRIGRAALAPWWTAQLLTGTKSFERNGVIGSRRLNQYGLHEARVRLAHDGRAPPPPPRKPRFGRGSRRFRARRFCHQARFPAARQLSPNCWVRSGRIAARCARSPRAIRSCARSRSIRAPSRRCRRWPMPCARRSGAV